MWARVIAGLIVLGIAIGCSRPPTPEFPRIAEADAAQTDYRPSDRPGNAFDDYVRVALAVEQSAPAFLTKVSFFPNERAQLLQRLGSEADRLVRATEQPCEFQFKARRPFQPAPFQAGWRLVARVVSWQIEADLAEGRFDAAVPRVVALTKFGFDLTGGGSTDASLGFALITDARRTIAPRLREMRPRDLSRLSAGLKAALARGATWTSMVDRERQNMRLAVFAVMEAFQKGEMDAMEAKLGPRTKDAFVYLRELKAGPESAQPAYFSGFLKESEIEADWAQLLAQTPAAKRDPEATPDFAQRRPWWRLAHVLLRTSRELLPAYEANVARTRLFILESELHRSVAQTRRAPTDLSAFSPELVSDPFTGEPFGYIRDGNQFSVYSLGLDGRDDGGQTDESFESPDLRVESRADR